jgi:hypothetical protein
MADWFYGFKGGKFWDHQLLKILTIQKFDILDFWKH